MRSILCKGIKTASYIVFILSVPMLIGSVCAYTHTQNFIQNATETTGVVVEMVSRDGQKGTTYAPVFTFKDKDGKSHKIFSRTSSYPPAYEVNDQIEILYSQNDYKSARIKSTFSLWGLPILLAIGGVVNLVMGMVFTFIYRKLA